MARTRRRRSRHLRYPSEPENESHRKFGHGVRSVPTGVWTRGLHSRQRTDSEAGSWFVYRPSGATGGRVPESPVEPRTSDRATHAVSQSCRKISAWRLVDETYQKPEATLDGASALKYRDCDGPGPIRTATGSGQRPGRPNYFLPQLGSSPRPQVMKPFEAPLSGGHPRDTAHDRNISSFLVQLGEPVLSAAQYPGQQRSLTSQEVQLPAFAVPIT
jgi:hypothetical protein